MLKLTIAFLSLACVSYAHAEIGSSDYSTQEVRGVSKVRSGTVVDMRDVKFHNPQQQKSNISSYANAGTALGGLIGGVAANALSNIYAVTAIGTTAGAVVGNQVYDYMNSDKNETTGVEVLIEFDNGEIVSITQGYQGVDFMVGSKVNVIYSQSGVRIWSKRPQIKKEEL